jgi:hypothetical protein
VCDVANHPDINKTSLKWNESEIGVLYKSLGCGSIKPHKILNSNKNGFKIYNFQYGKVSKLNNLKPFTNSILTPFYIKSEVGVNSKIAIHALLDSGAYSDNFCSLKTAKLLQDVGFTMVKTYSRVDMGVRDLSQPIIGKFKNISFIFFNFVNNQNESINLKNILIIDSFEDLIIGRPAMCKNNLWNKLFDNICCDCIESTCSPPNISNLSRNKSFNNLNKISLKKDLIDLPNGDKYIESFKEKINPEWIEANRLCNLTCRLIFY